MEFFPMLNCNLMFSYSSIGFIIDSHYFSQLLKLSRRHKHKMQTNMKVSGIQQTHNHCCFTMATTGSKAVSGLQGFGLRIQTPPAVLVNPQTKAMSATHSSTCLSPFSLSRMLSGWQKINKIT